MSIFTKFFSNETWQKQQHYCLGRDAKNSVISLSPDELKRNVLVLGGAGSGKSTLLQNLASQQTEKNGGWLFLDPYGSNETRDYLFGQAKAQGREKDFYVLDFTNPHNSHSYSPVKEGYPEEIAHRLLGLLPEANGDPGADYYRQSAARAMTIIINALQEINQAFSLSDLAELMISGELLEKLENQLSFNGTVKNELSEFLKQFLTRGKFQTSVDSYKLKTMLGGMAGRIQQLTQGALGGVLNRKNPDVDMVDVVKHNKMLYISLPMLRNGDVGSHLGKILLSDFRTSLASLREFKAKEEIPFVVFAEQLSSYWTPETAHLLHQNRKLNAALVMSQQSLDDLRELRISDQAIILGNTWTKILLPQVHVSDGLEKILKDFQASVIGTADYSRTLKAMRTGDGLVFSGADSKSVQLVKPVAGNGAAFAATKSPSKPHEYQTLEEALYQRETEALEEKMQQERMLREAPEIQLEKIDYLSSIGFPEKKPKVASKRFTGDAL